MRAVASFAELGTAAGALAVVYLAAVHVIVLVAVVVLAPVLPSPVSAVRPAVHS